MNVLNVNINSTVLFVILNVYKISSCPAIIAPEAVVLSHVNLGGSSHCLELLPLPCPLYDLTLHSFHLNYTLLIPVTRTWSIKNSESKSFKDTIFGYTCLIKCIAHFIRKTYDEFDINFSTKLISSFKFKL